MNLSCLPSIPPRNHAFLVWKNFLCDLWGSPLVRWYTRLVFVGESTRIYEPELSPTNTENNLVFLSLISTHTLQSYPFISHWRVSFWPSCWMRKRLWAHRSAFGTDNCTHTYSTQPFDSEDPYPPLCHLSSCSLILNTPFRREGIWELSLNALSLAFDWPMTFDGKQLNVEKMAVT